MAERTDRNDGRPAPRARTDDERRVAQMPEIADPPDPVPEAEKPPAAATVFGLQATLFFSVVVLAVIFVAAIILFAVTR